MSRLVYTAAFVRMGRSPFGAKPRDVAVFAQRLEGGSGLTMFSNLLDPGPVLRVRDQSVATADRFMAGFAIVESGLPLEGEAKVIAKTLRERASVEEIELTPAETRTLADAVGGLNIGVQLTGFEGAGEFEPGAFGDWTVLNTTVDA